MAVNKRLRADLLAKLGVTKQRLSQRVQRVRSDHGPMDYEDGAYLLAHMEGMDLTKYLSKEVTDRIRGMVPRNGGSAPKPRAAKRAPASSRPIRIATEAEVADALLAASVATEAKQMAAVYPKFYVFENSVRSLIQRVLEAKHGKGWWSTNAVPTEVAKGVQQRKDDEGKKPWHGRRGKHEIHYTDFKDLRKLITHNWEAFKEIFQSQQWITQRLEELEHPRNVIAHNNPVSNRDQDRIELYYSDWIDLLKARRGLIP